MVDHVITRDATCRGLGCRIPATLCDLDHEVPWPDGTTVWTLPSGRVYRVPPHQLLQHPDLDPEPLRVDPETVRFLRWSHPVRRSSVTGTLLARVLR
jgi:hypothetical protein